MAEHTEEPTKKSSEKGAKAHQMRRPVKAINTETNEFHTFTSKSQCAKYYNINPAHIYLICEGKNKVKTAKTEKGIIRFEYTDHEHMENRIDLKDARFKKPDTAIMVECDVCHKQVRKANMKKHETSKTHLSNLPK